MAAVVISIALQKGGVGKSVTSLNLAAELGLRKKRVLLIDLDAQANSTYSAGTNVNELEYSVYNVLTPIDKYKCDIKQAIINHKYFDLLPSDSAVNDLVLELKDFYALKMVLEQVQNDYDFIILDCPPAISMVTANAFIASQKIIIPSECKTYSVLGILEMQKNIAEIKNNYNPDLEVLGILLTKFDSRNVTKQLKELIDTVASQVNTKVYNHTIRNLVAVEECALNRIPLCDYKGSNKDAYKDYKGFVTETLDRLER